MVAVCDDLHDVNNEHTINEHQIMAMVTDESVEHLTKHTEQPGASVCPATHGGSMLSCITPYPR
jgi:hypothetical protein